MKGETDAAVQRGDGEQQLRPLGTFERFRAVLHDLGFHHNVAIVATYSGKTVNRELLISAVRAAVIQHPALSVTISGKDHPKPHFLALKEIELDELITFIDCPSDKTQRTEKIDEILSEQNSLHFSFGKLPLWRIIVFGQSLPCEGLTTDIAFVWHHVIGDGASGLAVHSTILQALSSPESISNEYEKETLQARSAISIPVPRKPLYPSMEEIFSLPRSLSLRISTLLSAWFPWRQKRRNIKKWSGAPYHCETPIKTRIRHISIPASSLKRLVQHCHREHTTITPVLQFLVGKTLCETFQDAQRLRCAVAISLRRFMPPQLHIHDDAMGLWVSAFHVEYSRNQLLGIGPGGANQRLWKEIRNNARRIQREIKKGDRDLSTGMLRYIPDFRATLVHKMGKKRDDSFAITNLGSFSGESGDGSKEGDSGSAQLRISNLLFSQSCHVNGSALQFCIVSVKDGDMNIAISWQEGTVEIADVERVAVSLKTALLDFSS